MRAERRLDPRGIDQPYLGIRRTTSRTHPGRIPSGKWAALPPRRRLVGRVVARSARLLDEVDLGLALAPRGPSAQKSRDMPTVWPALRGTPRCRYRFGKVAVSSPPIADRARPHRAGPGWALRRPPASARRRRRPSRGGLWREPPRSAAVRRIRRPARLRRGLGGERIRRPTRRRCGAAPAGMVARAPNCRTVPRLSLLPEHGDPPRSPWPARHRGRTRHAPDGPYRLLSVEARTTKVPIRDGLRPLEQSPGSRQYRSGCDDGRRPFPAFDFRHIPVNERQLRRAGRPPPSGVPFPLYPGRERQLG